MKAFGASCRREVFTRVARTALHSYVWLNSPSSSILRLSKAILPSSQEFHFKSGIKMWWCYFKSIICSTLKYFYSVFVFICFFNGKVHRKVWQEHVNSLHNSTVKYLNTEGQKSEPNQPFFWGGGGVLLRNIMQRLLASKPRCTEGGLFTGKNALNWSCNLKCTTCTDAKWIKSGVRSDLAGELNPIIWAGSSTTEPGVAPLPYFWVNHLPPPSLLTQKEVQGCYSQLRVCMVGLGLLPHY